MHEDLKIIKNGFDQIAAAKGKEKVAVIQRVCAEDHRVSESLILLFHPLVKFGIKEKSLNKKVRVQADKNYMYLLDVCQDLASKYSITNQDIANVQKYLSALLIPELKDFAQKYLTKSIRLGADAATVNKAFGKEVIPSFPCMLAKKYIDCQGALQGKGFTVTEKLDGIRCLAIIKSDQVLLISRQGQLIDGLVEIERELSHLRKRTDGDFVLDGELLVSDREGIPSKDQYKNTIMIVRKDGRKEGITYNVFDFLPLYEYERRVGKLPYWSRRNYLHQIMQRTIFVKPLPILYTGKDVSVIDELLAAQRRMNHEGIMINLNNSTYKFGRTDALLKYKVMQDVDLEIIDMQEGNGKYAGSLGALIVDYKGTPVGVGSGMSNEEREEMWRHREDYIGRVVKVQYFEETHGDDGLPSLRFPVFLELCEPGKEVSYN